MDQPRYDLADSDATTLDRDLLVDVLHELRSPLTVVGGRVFQLRQQLCRGDADPAQMSAKLDEISKAASSMAAALELLVTRATLGSGPALAGGS